MTAPDELHRRRVRHYDVPFEAHSLTFTCFRRLPLLASDRTRLFLTEALNRALVKHPFDLWAYAIMPEHVHMLVWPTRDDARIEALLKSIKQSVARREIAYVKEHRPDELLRLQTGNERFPHAFWMDGPGYDRNMLYDTTLRNVVDYIHNNPVRRGLVPFAEDWRWSSALDWSGQGNGPVCIARDSFPT